MSDKLKIIQTSIAGDKHQETDLFCASIGYPNLKAQSNAVMRSHCSNSEQPDIDESAFDRLIEAYGESKSKNIYS